MHALARTSYAFTKRNSQNSCPHSAAAAAAVCVCVCRNAVLRNKRAISILYVIRCLRCMYFLVFSASQTHFDCRIAHSPFAWWRFFPFYFPLLKPIHVFKHDSFEYKRLVELREMSFRPPFSQSLHTGLFDDNKQTPTTRVETTPGWTVCIILFVFLFHGRRCDAVK